MAAQVSSAVTSTWQSSSTDQPRCGSRISVRHDWKLAVREVLNLYTQEILTAGDRVALFVFGTTAVRKAHLSSNAERFIEQVSRIAAPGNLSGDAFPWDSDITTAFEHVYQSLDNQDRFEAGEEDWAPEPPVESSRATTYRRGLHRCCRADA